MSDIRGKCFNIYNFHPVRCYSGSTRLCPVSGTEIDITNVEKDRLQITPVHPDSCTRSRIGTDPFFVPGFHQLCKRLPPMWPGFDSRTRLNFICGLSLLLILVLAPRGFSPGTPVFPSLQKPTLLNSNSIWKVSPISALR